MLVTDFWLSHPTDRVLGFLYPVAMFSVVVRLISVPLLNYVAFFLQIPRHLFLKTGVSFSSKCLSVLSCLLVGKCVVLKKLIRPTYIVGSSYFGVRFSVFLHFIS